MTTARAARVIRPAGGFTLIEVLAATAATAVLGALLLTVWLQAVQATGRAETERRLFALRDALAQHYRDQASLVEQHPQAALALARTQAGDVLLASGAELSAEALAPLQGRLSLPLNEASRDGHGTPFRLWITAPLSGLVEGTAVTYRRMAIVSAGRNQRFDSTAWNAEQGIFSPAGDDRVAVIDGLTIVRPQVMETRRRMARLAGLIAGYAGARFLAHPARDPGIDYFAGVAAAAANEAPWDDAADNALARRSTKTAAGLTSAELATLGLSAAEAQDAWGSAIDFDNDGADVRHPEQALPGLRTPPFTARLVATMPGGTQLVETVIATN